MGVSVGLSHSSGAEMCKPSCESQTKEWDEEVDSANTDLLSQELGGSRQAAFFAINIM